MVRKQTPYKYAATVPAIEKRSTRFDLYTVNVRLLVNSLGSTEMAASESRL